jgi:PAS domain S-box-containing protein
VPLAVLVTLMAAFWMADLRFSYDPPWLLFTCNFLFATLASAFVCQLVCRSFLAQGTPSLLMLACGVVLWGLAGVLAVGFAGTSDNAMLTIHNVCAWLSAGCHLLSVVWWEPRRRLRPEGWWLLGGVLVAVGSALAVVRAALTGWTPVFFVQGEGGTLVRDVVLASSVGMFALSAIVLRGRQRGAPSAFAQWYGLGLWLIAAGLAGLTMQKLHGSALGWTARTALWLGGIYFVMAALAAARHSGAREISLVSPPADARLRYVLAVVFVAVAVVLRLLLVNHLGTRAVAITFFPAIILAALYGGRGPGLLAGLLSAVAIHFLWAEPIGRFSTGASGDWVIVVFLMASATAISFLAEAMQTARSRASAAETEARLADERRTERAAADEARARLAAIVETSDDAIVGKNLDGIITNWNRGAERIFGYSAPEIVGQPVLILIPPERHNEEADIIGHIRRGERVEHFETVRRRKDGTLFDVSLTVSPILDGEGKIIGASKIARDITARKQAEKERRALEEALVARADQLAQADRSKDEFLAMLAHELRNPLAPLRNAAELLQADDASADERTEVQRIISRQIENMSRMLDDLLDVSRITAGKIELRRKPVALEGILTSAVSLVRSTCAAQKQILAVSLPNEPVYLNADATRLEQVFGNLLSNACKYSGEGCHISISAERVRNAEPPEVLVTVRDDGAGIEPELLPRIFDLFVQASRTLDRSHGGLGIGLTLVQRLVKLHGGSVEALSEGHGRGAEFVVRLPILAEVPVLEPLPAAPSTQSSPGPKRRILIVDDNTDAARSLATLQQRRGHETRSAFTGPDAVTVAAEFLPDVVLLDIGLPGMDGFEVARKIRAIPALTGALLIAMSGYGREEDRAEAKLAGFNEYMVKPVDLDTLRDWLQNGSRR